MYAVTAKHCTHQCTTYVWTKSGDCIREVVRPSGFGLYISIVFAQN